MDDLSVEERRGAAGAVGGESEVTASGSPVLTAESNLCWAPLHAHSLLGLSRKTENEQLELFSCCLSDAKGHVCSFPYGNYVAWLVVLGTCTLSVCFNQLKPLEMWANILSFVPAAVFGTQKRLSRGSEVSYDKTQRECFGGSGHHDHRRASKTQLAQHGTGKNLQKYRSAMLPITIVVVKLLRKMSIRCHKRSN